MFVENSSPRLAAHLTKLKLSLIMPR